MYTLLLFIVVCECDLLTMFLCMFLTLKILFRTNRIYSTGTFWHILLPMFGVKEFSLVAF
jgi:hypothetical protein